MITVGILLVAYLCLASAGKAGQDQPEGVLHRRTYFHIGGSYVDARDSSTQVAHGQMYVEHLVPAVVTQPLPLLFIHGLGMTGSNFLNTPDGRLGWADYFMSKGYEVYLVDQPARARSAWQSGVDGDQFTPTTSFVESYFTAARRYNIWPQASLHTQWPGNGSVGDETFDAFYMSVVPSLRSTLETSQLVKAAGSQLLDRIGPVILVTHSQSGAFGWILADSRPSQVAAIVALEPSGPPFHNAILSTGPARPFGLTDIPLTFFPPITSAADLHPVAVSSNDFYTCFQQSGSPPKRLINLVDIPVLVVTAEASYHAVYDDCSARFLAEAGVPVRHVQLEDVGIHGNGHMMFMEKNGLEIAENVIEKWLRSTLGLSQGSHCPLSQSHMVACDLPQYFWSTSTP